MKTTISFTIPEEREELDAALKGSLYKAKINELYDQVFRPHLKYNKPILEEDESKMQELTEKQFLVVEALWKKVAEHFEDVLE
jgi:hypothetical protein